MRLKWFLVAFLCVTLLNSALVVRAQHENEEDNEDEGAMKEVEGDEDMIETRDVPDAVEEATADDGPVEEEEKEEQDPPSEDSPPPEEEGQAQESDVEEVEVNAPASSDVEGTNERPKPKVGRRLGNYYYDEDYYSSNYDVDVNYDWSE